MVRGIFLALMMAAMIGCGAEVAEVAPPKEAPEANNKAQQEAAMKEAMEKMGKTQGYAAPGGN